jgi:hypothetical protein
MSHGENKLTPSDSIHHALVALYHSEEAKSEKKILTSSASNKKIVEKVRNVKKLRGLNSGFGQSRTKATDLFYFQISPGESSIRTISKVLL